MFLLPVTRQRPLAGHLPRVLPVALPCRLGWLISLLIMGTVFHPHDTLGQPLQPTPSLVTPNPAWGGHLLPEQVPYQPTLESPKQTFTLPPATVQSGFWPSSPPPDLLPLAAGAAPKPDLPVPGDDISGDGISENGPLLPPGTRDGVFQKIFFTGTWLPQLAGDSLGWGDLESGVVLGFPLLHRDTPLLVTPRFAAHLLEKPDSVDLPDQVYDTSVEFRHLRKFGESPWGMDVAVRLGYYSDFERSADDAFRVTGYGLGAYESSPGTKWVLGAAYLNRANATILPIGGVLIERSPGIRWELIVPRPRVAWRLAGSVADHDERWFYVAGEFGGGGWSIVRPDSQKLDRLFYSDYRVLIGYERKIIGGLSRLYEMGYVFNRKLQLDSLANQASLDDTLFLRVGLTY